MSVERIDSLFSIPQIQQEFANVQTGLAESQKALVDLFNTTKQYKDTTLTNLASNTERLTTAITGSVEATTRAKTNFDNLTNSISAQVRAANDNAAAITNSSAGWDKLIQQSVRNKIALDNLTASQSALKKSFQDGTIGMGEYENSLASIKEAQTNLKTSNADITKTINNLSKEASSASGSLNQMRATLNLLTQSYDKLSASEQQSSEGQSLQKTIQTTNKALTDLEVSTGRSQRKVGDYTGALKILEAALAETNQRLSAMAAAGQQNTSTYAKTAEEVELLNVLVGQQSKGFSSVTMEIRAAERALQTLRAEGFGASEAFDQLRDSTIQANQQQKEFQRQQKLLEGEAPVLGAITLAAKGLAGAYAIGQGAVSLFADGNEKLAKDLNKMIAIMTILQGLHEVYELIQQSGAISLAIKTAAVRAATAMQAKNTAATQGQTAANLELAASEAPVIVETEAQTVAMGELTVAAEGTAVAETEVAVATTTLKTALIATGIGAAIAAIAVAILYVLSKVPDWIKGNQMAIKQQEELAGVIKEANDQLIAQAKLFTDNDDVSKKYYEGQLALSQAAGNNEEKNFAIKKAITAEEKSMAQDQVNYLGASNEQQIRLKNTLIDLNLQKQKAIDMNKDLLAIPEQDLPSELKDQQEAAKKNVEFFQKKIDATQSLYEAGKKAREDLFAANLKTDKEETDEQKFTADERRKIILESISLEVDYTKEKNSLILGDDKSTLEQRLAALRSNAQAERRLAEANKNNVLTDPGASSADRKLAIDKAAEAERKVTMESADAISKLKRSYYIRDRDATMEAAQDLLNDDIKNNDLILAEEKTRFRQRTELEIKNFQDRRAILGAQLLRDLDQQGLTNEQRLAIEQKYNSDLTTLTIDQAKTRQAEQKREQERQLKDVEELHDKQLDAAQVKGSQAIVDLNNSPAAKGGGLAGLTEYNRKRKDLEYQAAQDSLGIQIQNDFAKVNSYKEGTKERDDAEAKLSKDVQTYSDNSTKHLQENRKELADAEMGLAQGTADLIKSAIDDRYENELNHIQKLTEANDRARAKEIEGINSSTLSAQEKANAIIIANARVDAQNKLLADRAKKIKHDEAVADKAFNVAAAIEAGIVAVLKSLPNIPLSIIVGATAAINVARIIATPIPAYKTGAGVDGKPLHPGGLARVHRDELIIEPGKSPYTSPGDDVLMDLAKHTRVIPADKIRQMDEAGMFINRQGRLVFAGDDTAKEMRSVKEALIWQTQELKQALKNQKRTVVNHIHVDTSWGEYVNKAVFK
jgi:hypothetical protein